MSPEAGWPWSVLDLPRDADSKDVRRAYARKLKAIDQATDIEGFSQLRSAYDMALRLTGVSGKPAATRQHTLPDPPAPQRPEAAPAFKPDPAVISPASDNPPEPQIPKPPPVTIELDTPPTQPTPLPRDPERTKAEQLREILSELSARLPWSQAGHRIKAALTNPIASDPDTTDAVRRGIRDEVVRAFAETGGVWPASISPTLLRDLDAKYGWLSDYKSAERDFRGHRDLIDEMYAQSYGDRFDNAAAQRETLKAQRTIGHSWLTLRAVYFGAIAILFWTVSRALSAVVEPGSLASRLLIVGLIAVLIGAVVVSKPVLARLEPIAMRYTLILVERSSDLRDKCARFRLPLPWRAITTTFWLVSFIVFAVIASGFEARSFAILSGLTFAAGVLHELAQSWLNAGRDP